MSKRSSVPRWLSPHFTIGKMERRTTMRQLTSLNITANMKVCGDHWIRAAEFAAYMPHTRIEAIHAYTCNAHEVSFYKFASPFATSICMSRQPTPSELVSFTIRVSVLSLPMLLS